MNGLLDFGTVTEHAISIFGSHMVQIDVDGESGHIEAK